VFIFILGLIIIYPIWKSNVIKNESKEAIGVVDELIDGRKSDRSANIVFYVKGGKYRCVPSVNSFEYKNNTTVKIGDSLRVIYYIHNPRINKVDWDSYFEFNCN